ncbi:MAG: hypothetical protein U0R49_04075 [Fimbriimonadales bacterium]
MASDAAWVKIADDIGLRGHDFSRAPLPISAAQIKEAVQGFKKTNQTEPRLLCKQDTRDSRPEIFKEYGLFILPVRNKHYILLRGDGYVDIPTPPAQHIAHKSILSFEPRSSLIGNSEMQHLDLAYASSVIRTFCDDPNLVLTIRGRKYTSAFECRAGGHLISVQSVQTEVDAGFESESEIVLVEAKPKKVTDTIIRQLYFPFRQWAVACPGKPIRTLFFSKEQKDYLIWEFGFSDISDYNSIRLIGSSRIRVSPPPS